MEPTKKTVEINETDKVISEDTFNQFREMGTTLLELKAMVKKQADIIAAYKVYFELITHCVIGFTGTFGLNNAENTMIRESILNGEESPMRAILKNITGLMTDAAQSEMNPRKKAEMEQRFDFFKHLPAVAEFYKMQQAIKVPIAPEVLKNLPESVQKQLQP